MAFITVSDAAGRILFRRRATDVEMEEARRAAEDADAGAEASMHEIAQQRYAALAAGTTIEEHLTPPDELAELEAFEPRSSEPDFEEEPTMAQAESHEVGLFGDEEAADDSWFGDARFMDEEEVAS